MVDTIRQQISSLNNPCPSKLSLHLGCVTRPYELYLPNVAVMQAYVSIVSSTQAFWTRDFWTHRCYRMADVYQTQFVTTSQLRRVCSSELSDHVYGFLHFVRVLMCFSVKRLRDIYPTLYSRPLLNALHPGLDIGQII